MSGKSRRGHFKQSSQSKKKKGKLGYEAVATRQPAATPASEPVAVSGAVTPSASASTPKPKPAVIRHPFIAIELRRIGILAGIMLVILVVLAVVLS